MNKHFQNIAIFINSIYVAWLMILSSLSNIIYIINSGIYSWEFYFHIFVLFLFTPILVQYHLLKTVDVWGNKNK